MREADLTIDELTAGGDGVGRLGGRPVLVPFTLPGERVRVRLSGGPRRSGAASVEVGSLIEVLRASPHRVVPRCRHFGPGASPGVGPCGGCSWQHIAYPEQLRLKTALLDRLVRVAVPRAPKAKAMIAATPLDRPWGYRHKVHFVFGTQGDRPVMGHYVRGSRRIIPVEECPVHDEHGNDVAFTLRNRLSRRQTRRRSHDDMALRGVAIRVGHRSGEIMATIVVRHTLDKRLREATREAVARDPRTSYHLNIHPGDDRFIFGRETRTLSGHERMREEVHGAAFLVSPTAFFQTNVAAAERLVELVLAEVPRGARVLDLYAGAGLFSIPLALAGHTVTGIEENRAAVADGEASLRLNRLDAGRCRFIARKVEAALGSIAGADVVVLDPPREGCTPGVIDGVFGRLRPAIAIYVSCNPEALATDLQQIAGLGYRIRSIQPVDMFPHTAHIEAVVVLTR